MGKRRIKVGFLTLVAFVGATILSCGGGGGVSSSTSGGIGGSSSTIKGKAIDDPLKGAKVCLDKNNNGKCDADEPSAITNGEGYFTLSVNNPSDKDKYPVVVEVNSNTEGNTAGGNFTLIAPPGKYKIVSPLTSLVYAEMRKNPGISPDEAEKILREKFGTNISFFEDYTSASNTDVTKVKKLAQITAKIVAEFVKKINSIGITISDNQYDELFSVLYGIIADHIDEIAYDIQNNGTSMDTIAGNFTQQISNDTIVHSIEYLSEIQNAKPITNIWDFVNNEKDKLYSLSLTDGMYSSQRIVKRGESKIKLKDIADVSDFSDPSKIYDKDKAFGGFSKDSNGNVFLKYGIYKWKINGISEVDLGGKTVNVCSLLVSDYDREEASKHAKDLCQKVNFQSGDKMYMITMELLPIDMKDNATLLSIGRELGPNNFAGIEKATSLEDYIRENQEGSSSYFSLTGEYKMQFKPSDPSNLLKGDIVIKNSGADIGDYWTISDGSDTYLVINTIVGGAIAKWENGRIYFQVLDTKPVVQTSVFLNDSAMNRIISAIKPKIKPLPDGATYPNVGFNYFTQNNTFSSDYVRVAGLINNNQVNDNCTADYSNYDFTLNNCQNSDISFDGIEVSPYNYGYNTIFIDPSSRNFLVSYRLIYFDSDTMCIGKGFFNFVDDEFCITKEDTPSKQDITELFQQGNKFAYYELDNMWSLKYCLKVEGNSGGALQFKAYEYKTGKNIEGTITIEDGQALLHETTGGNGDLMKNVIKIDKLQGLIIGFNPSENRTVIMIETDSCPIQ
jgi:hypothetical protein